MHLRPPHARRAGFTLLELMVVIAIIGILMAALLVGGGSLFRDAKKNDTRNRLNTLSTLINEYRTIEGDYPDDRLPAGVSGGNVNGNAEALFVAFWDAEYSGELPNEAWLGNTDSDTASRSITRLPDRQLFELVDAWGNPIVYFDSLHYDSVAVTMAGFDGVEGGMLSEQQVVAAKSDKTGAFLAPTGFQLISAGADGEFGTDDDLTHP